MPLLASVKAGPDHSVAVTWKFGDRKGRVETIDLEPAIFAYRSYRPLRNSQGLFGTVHPIDEGNAIGWGDGEIDMAATAVERLAAESMTDAEFKAWLSANNLSYASAGAALGLSRRMVIYDAKDKAIPRYIALACRGYEATMAGRG